MNQSEYWVNIKCTVDASHVQQRKLGFYFPVRRSIGQTTKKFIKFLACSVRLPAQWLWSQWQPPISSFYHKWSDENGIFDWVWSLTLCGSREWNLYRPFGPRTFYHWATGAHLYRDFFASEGFAILTTRTELQRENHNVHINYIFEQKSHY